jgi:phage/plasmid primase-like uncharacterized protein
MIDPATISAARATPIESVIDQCGIRLRGRVERVGPCPVCGGDDRFSINTKKQVFHCRGCGKGGDVIALVQHLDSSSFHQAVATLAGPLRSVQLSLLSGKPDRERERREAEADALARRRLRTAVEAWDKSRPITGTPGEIYLAKRVMLDEVPERGGLQFHPHCPWESGTAPCVVARFTDAITGEPRGIHRRPITGAKPKALGAMKGCVIRLWPDEDVAEGLVIGEGVETTLAAATLIEHKGTLLQPAWAAGCAGNLEDFPLLPGVEALTILVDHDESGRGQKAAEICARRWRDAGREVIRLMPADLGLDFNDLVKP